MFRQWKAMRAQLDQMENAGKQTDTLIERAGKQIEQLRIAAEAAKQSADALINSERAWIMVDIKWQENTNIAYGGGTPSREQFNIAYVVCTCRNQGNTPAWITEEGYVCKVVDSPLPKEPDFSNVEVFQYSPEPLASGDHSEYKLEPKFAGWIRDGKLRVIYGRVKYRDVFTADGETRETRFGYALTDGPYLERLTGVQQEHLRAKLGHYPPAFFLAFD